MNVDLKHLIRLQSIDLSILEIQERINVFPGISKALDTKLSTAAAALDAAHEEYKAFQKEIEHAQEGIRGVEDKILTLMMAAEGVQAEIKAAEARLKEDQQRVNQERKGLEAEHQKDVTALE